MVESGSNRKDASENKKTCMNITHDAVAKFIKKFQRNRSVADQHRSGRRQSLMKAQLVRYSQNFIYFLNYNHF